MRRPPYRFHGLLAGLAALLALLAGPAPAGTVWLPGIGGNNNLQVRSLLDLKFDKVVRQQYDFSCGSAALATLLTFHYGEPTTEQETFGAMYAKGDQQKIRQVGFSLLDMKNYLAGRGYQADGYKASLDTLSEAGVAAIALVNTKGYQHFVVVKGLDQDRVLVGDPALGTRMVARDVFEASWPTQILFIIRNHAETGRQYFNSAEHWRSTPGAPMDSGRAQALLDTVLLSLPPIGTNGLGTF